MLSLIWAESANGVIGRDGALPWRLPEDLAHFQRATDGGTVVMGRRTWESLPQRYRPLPGRRNVVLTRDAGYVAPGAEVVADVDAALAGPGEVWVAGGAQVYAAVLERADRLVVTEVDAQVEGDTRAPERGEGWVLASTDPAEGWATSRTGLRWRVRTYVRA
ncbi:dihydrofolate reductase [Kineococcus terrestris]|uniref:dihydrofolate reductase n=1 Tax=Kineococcus terrestris TaxID=2044856 RepID=UPI0034DB6448